MMRVSDTVGLALHNLFLHKVRSVLTSLGVIFGVGSVIAMLAISEGAKRAALEQIEAMGIDKIIVFTQQPAAASSSEGSGRAGMVRQYGLNGVDLAHLRALDNVKHVTTVTNTRKPILRGLQPTELNLVGADPGFLEDSGSTIAEGRWFSSLDMRNNAYVCVIGSDVKRTLFTLGQRGIVGSSLRIENNYYRIIGILDNSRGTQYPGLSSPNTMILLPSSTAKVAYDGYSFAREGSSYKITKVRYDLMLVTVEHLEFIDNTSRRLRNYMEKAHRAQRDWGMTVPQDLLKQREATQNIFTIVMSSIAGISLIVGGIGIMNIMLASVYERRKEIGTRLALGAQKSDILRQFLVETVFLTTLGGVLGIGLGIGIAKTITLYSKMPTQYSLWSILLSLGIASLVGVVFGTYPAWKAAQQNPITVLRAE
ncbi:MAG: ABC transporter permease [Victivallaceae bacterium]|nr:ABC transporter permease [Victivallaceae bacterium]